MLGMRMGDRARAIRFAVIARLMIVEIIASGDRLVNTMLEGWLADSDTAMQLRLYNIWLDS